MSGGSGVMKQQWKRLPPPLPPSLSLSLFLSHSLPDGNVEPRLPLEMQRIGGRLEREEEWMEGLDTTAADC